MAGYSYHRGKHHRHWLKVETPSNSMVLRSHRLRPFLLYLPETGGSLCMWATHLILVADSINLRTTITGLIALSILLLPPTIGIFVTSSKFYQYRFPKKSFGRPCEKWAIRIVHTIPYGLWSPRILIWKYLIRLGNLSLGLTPEESPIIAINLWFCDIIHIITDC